jgi:hypothetical protein
MKPMLSLFEPHLLLSISIYLGLCLCLCLSALVSVSNFLPIFFYLSVFAALSPILNPHTYILLLTIHGIDQDSRGATGTSQHTAGDV